MFSKVKNVKSHTYRNIISTAKSLFYLLKALPLIIRQLLIAVLYRGKSPTFFSLNDEND